MIVPFRCPHCKGPLDGDQSIALQCGQCELSFNTKHGYIDFLREQNFYAGEISQEDINILLHDIDTEGYNNAVLKFVELNPQLRQYLLDVKRIDWLCHCLTKSNNSRCLDLGSGLGNLSESLSHIYQEVYSLEAVTERIELQKKRYKNAHISNITIVRGNALELPFEDNFFDLIVCNGVLEWIGMMNKSFFPRDLQLSFLREVRRVLSNEGFLYIGIENRVGIQYLLGANDHSGIPYTSLMPRFLANIIAKRYGRYGGIYGGSVRKPNEDGYYTYTYTYHGYRSLLSEARLGFTSFWVYPTYNEPNFSGNTDDKTGIKGFVRYLRDNVIYQRKRKILISLIEKIDKSTLLLLACTFAPSFLFYCYKGNEKTETFDDMVIRSTSSTNYTCISRGSGIMYLVYDKNAQPMKVVRLKRQGEALKGQIPFYDKTAPLPTSSIYLKSERAWQEDWIKGKRLNPLNPDESKMALEWLIQFQKNSNTSQVKMTKEECLAEVDKIRNSLKTLSNLNTSENRRWIDDYERYLTNVTVNRSAEHGDFSYGNIIVNKQNDITVVDWEHFRNNGDPFFDFSWYILTAMRLPGDTIESFILSLTGNGSFMPIIGDLLDRVERHFSFEPDLGVLLPYSLIRFITMKYIADGFYEEVFGKMLDYLSTNPTSLNYDRYSAKKTS
jgi:ubiquinone/menaquinone biosynthesis C-methylase UbiE